MANFVTLAQPFYNNNANAIVSTTPVALLGIFVNSGNGAVTITDTPSGTGGNVVVSGFTPALGWNWMPFRTNTGLTINIAAALNYTISLAG